MKQHTIILTLVAAFIASAGVSGRAQAASNSCGTGCCNVTNSDNPEEGVTTQYPGSLNDYLIGFNEENERYRSCYDEIRFSPTTVKIRKSLELTFNDEDGIVIGNEGTQTTWKSYLDAGEPMLTISGVNHVTLQNITIQGNGHIKCDGATDIELVNVDAESRSGAVPGTVLEFSNCNSITINGTDITGSSSSDASASVIIVQGTADDWVDTVSIQNTNLTNVKGKGLYLEYANNVTLEEYDVSSSTSATAAYINYVAFTKLHASADKVYAGFDMNHVDGTDLSDVSLALSGPGNGTGTGDGLILNQDAKYMTFNDLSVDSFGGNGVVIKDGSDSNTFNGIEVYNNGGYGLTIQEYAQDNAVRNGSIYNNGNCGIYLSSENQNIVELMQLPNNGEGCAIGSDNAARNLSLASSDVILAPGFDNKILVDVNTSALTTHTDAIGANSPVTMELHYLTSNSGDGGSGGDTSRVTDPFDIADLPDSSVSVKSSSEDFFAIVQDGNGYVVGIWYGEADYAASDNCYVDPDSNTKVRIYDASLDTDGDGLKDWEEDGNMNCIVEDDETDSDDADSDDDGINDYQETKGGATGGLTTDTDEDGLLDARDNDSDHDDLDDGVEDKDGDGNVDADETDPLKADTDGDGLNDGVEDINKNGEVDANETNPRQGYNDTDQDGSNDLEDSCPLLSPEDGVCYYDHCTPGQGSSVESDEDGDGILSSVEDANLDCELSAGEMNANSADTDGDGISDGTEYYLGKTNPLSTDSDSDGISDGAEDDNADGIVDLGNGETDPTLTDSDGDTITDGDEDLNHDGGVDSGETNPSLSDTDADGNDDAGDICPWEKNASCVVRYCKVSGYDSYDADGDSLPDKEEDSDGDCSHTVSNKESNPLASDTDADGLTDDLEACYTTNPNIADTDGDGRSDFQEVESSGDTCQPMYNLGSTNPLRAEYGNCALIRGEATSSGITPIIVMMAAILGLLGLRRTAALKG